MSKSASKLTDHLGYWLRYVSNNVSHAFAAKVSTKGVTVAEWVLMRTLYDTTKESPSRIAGELGMTRGAITKLADRLIDKGLLARCASPNDRRAQTLSLTTQGAKLVPELAALADANDADFFGQLSAADRRTLRRVLKQLVADAKMTNIPTQ